ncbi:MAG: FG-GAP repeat domain-containing protein [Tepidisphaerales bacterium]
MPLARRTRRSNAVEQLEERCLFAVTLPSDPPNYVLPTDGTFAFGDINGDGQLDLVQATQGTDSRTGIAGWGVDLYINRGAGQPAALTVPGQLRQGPHITAIPNIGGTAVAGRACAVIGDVNGDGINDIVVYVISQGVATRTPHGGILLGDGKGGFKPGGTFDLTGMVSTETNWGMSLADFNGDKRNDLFVYTYTATPPYNITSQTVTLRSTVGIALNNGAGSFRDIAYRANPLAPVLPPAPLPAGSPAQGKYSYFRVLGAGDLNGDGKAEIVCQLDTDTVNFTTPTSFNPLAFGANQTIVLPGAQAATGAQSVSPTTSQTPLGNVLSPPPPVPSPLPVFGNLPKPNAVATPQPAAKPAFAFLTDVNHDGLADIAVLRGSTIYVGVNRSLQAPLSQRPAIAWKQLAVAVPVNPLGPAGNTTMSMFVGDLNGTGMQTLCFLLIPPFPPPFLATLPDPGAILGVQSLPPA